MLAPSWAVLGDFEVILRHVGGKMATESAKMNQHRRQEANPRGFEGSAGASGREAHPGVRPFRLQTGGAPWTSPRTGGIPWISLLAALLAWWGRAVRLKILLLEA